MRVTSKGQVTIPIALREKTGILPESEVEFGLKGDTITIKRSKTNTRRRRRIQEVIERARGTGTENRELTTDQIMALTRGWGEDDLDR